MDTQTLRHFQQIADGTTVTEAAELFQVSQPGVSRGLRRLEEELGTPLLERSGRVLRLTHAGHVFKRHVDALLHALDDGIAAVDELIDPETGLVRVAFQLSLGAWLIPRAIEGFRRQHTRVRFRLIHSEDALDSALLAEGHADLEFTARRPHNPEVRWRKLLTQPLYLAVPPSHRLAARTEIGLAEVADEPFVLLNPAWELRSVTEELCRAAGFAPTVAFEAHGISVVRGLVAVGLGVSIVPADPAGSGRPPLSESPDRLIRLSDPGAFREVGVTWVADRRLLPSAELFRNYVSGFSHTT